MRHRLRKAYARATSFLFGWWWILVETSEGKVYVRRVRVNDFGTPVISGEFLMAESAVVEPNGAIGGKPSMKRWKHFSGDRGRQAFEVTHKLRQITRAGR